MLYSLRKTCKSLVVAALRCWIRRWNAYLERTLDDQFTFACLRCWSLNETHCKIKRWARDKTRSIPWLNICKKSSEAVFVFWKLKAQLAASCECVCVWASSNRCLFDHWPGFVLVVVHVPDLVERVGVHTVHELCQERFERGARAPMFVLPSFSNCNNWLIFWQTSRGPFSAGSVSKQHLANSKYSFELRIFGSSWQDLQD